jgi:RNA polymerase primary sigma factor
MLSPKEKEIRRLRFGIGEEGEHTSKQVGKRFEVTRERIARSGEGPQAAPSARDLRAFIEN